MQQDGNVVLYGPTADPTRGPNSTAMWSSRTRGSGSHGLEIPCDRLDSERNLQLRLEDDGNLVLYDLADNRSIWSSGTHVDLDPNKVVLVHPEGENDVVYEAVNAAQRALQDSVDLFGRQDGTVPVPLDLDMLVLGLTIPDLTGGIQDLIEEANSIAAKFDFVDDLNRSTLERINAEIAFLNDAMRSARPPMDSPANDTGNRRCYLTDSDTQAVLRIIGDSAARVAEWVAECQRLNKKAAPAVRQSCRES